MIFKDRKKFDYDMISLKRNLNLCKEQNNKLKDQMNILKKQVISKRKYVNELFGEATKSFCRQERASLGPNAEIELKKYVKTLEKEIEKATRDREELIKGCRESELIELKEKLTETLEECKMLRSMIIVANELDDKGDIKQLSAENKRLMKIIKRQSCELGQFKESNRKSGLGIRLKPRISELRKSTKSLGLTPGKRPSKKSLQSESEYKKDKNERESSKDSPIKGKNFI